jgi:hypothetical protein
MRRQSESICLKVLDIDLILVEISLPGRGCYKCLDINVDMGRSGVYHLLHISQTYIEIRIKLSASYCSLPYFFEIISIFYLQSKKLRFTAT